jgi:hypothetical protein
VQFEADGTDIGRPVSLHAGGVATTIAAFSGGAAAAVSAAFTPTSTAYIASAATGTTNVTGDATQAGSISLAVTVPLGGYLAVTVVPGTVTLSVPSTATRSFATGMLQPVTVTEYRNYQPGWSVTGEVSNLSAAGQPVPGTRLGWIPGGTVTGGAILGPPVAPGNPGLGSAGAVLATAAPGSGVGVDTLTAILLLRVPASARAGPFAGTLTLTFVESGPLPAPPGGSLQLPPVH